MNSTAYSSDLEGFRPRCRGSRRRAGCRRVSPAGSSGQLQLAQLLHVGAAGAEDVADIGAAGQVAHADPDQPALELEILAHAADPERLAVAARRLADRLKRGSHAVMRVLAGDAHLGTEVAGADMQRVDAV